MLGISLTGVRTAAIGLIAAGLLFAMAPGTPAAETDAWQAGFARVVITPDEPMWLSGYGAREKPSEGTIHDLWAKAAALRDSAGKTVVFVSTDLIGVPAEMARVVSEAVEKKHGLARADLMLTCSHTHCGPALDDMLSHMLAMNDGDWDRVRRYQQQLNARLIELIDAALEDLQPARLSAGGGACGFAVNRRAPIGTGPSDHSVPVLRVTSADGETLRGVIFGYACHNTTLSLYEWCGDYAGYAMISLEERHPGAVALFWTGCGADQNPLPRRTIELAEKYGRALALTVESVLQSEMTPVAGRLRTAFRRIDLEFESLPTAEEIAAQLESENRFVRARGAVLQGQLQSQGELPRTYPYPVQVWTLGDEVTWVALGGEIVVDYSLRLKRELAEGHTWVTGYANDVMGYIPSERVLAEGGYEGGGSMLYYQLPSPWKSGLEEAIVGAVRAMHGELRESP